MIPLPLNLLSWFCDRFIVGSFIGVGFLRNQFVGLSRLMAVRGVIMVE